MHDYLGTHIDQDMLSVLQDTNIYEGNETVDHDTQLVGLYLK